MHNEVDTMKIAIYGYGNLGKGVECAVRQAPDMELTGVFTRRAPETVKTLWADTRALPAADIANYKNEIDVLVICGGSATDLPQMTPELARHFNVVDSFDTHAAVSEHFARVDKAAGEGGKVALISCGWDPGMFSLNRLYAAAILPEGRDYTFWGKGVSQGHSDAIRRIPGVKDARQYTVPIEQALKAVRSGSNPELTTAQKHLRECYVVAEEGADQDAIRQQIVTMPNYFADYTTTVTFITEAEMAKNHAALPHGGLVIRTGTTGVNAEHNHVIEYSLKLDSNPEFTASVLTAYARAVYKLSCRGDRGCKTVFDIVPGDLSPLSAEELRAHLL